MHGLKRMIKRAGLRMRPALAACLALFLLLAACGSEAEAAAMRLTRTQGDVNVSDGAGVEVALLENLSLYSGYGVGTSQESYAWINLDDVKLAKMDQTSEIAIQKEGKNLEIEVKSGSLFFHVTEPLAEDETMEIRTSTMGVGIRGTCGWVAEGMVALLEGTVIVTAGEIPAFVQSEIAEYEKLQEALQAISGEAAGTVCRHYGT